MVRILKDTTSRSRFVSLHFFTKDDSTAHIILNKNGTIHTSLSGWNLSIRVSKTVHGAVSTGLGDSTGVYAQLLDGWNVGDS